MSTKIIKDLAITVALVGAIILAASIDREAIVESDAIYCEMTAIWALDSELGIPPSERHGWPPYNSAIECP